MSYIKTEWDNGDIITAEKLNNVESGIEGINVSYEKTTWETGDKITAVKLNNIETGIEEAGSSDFSTATVTIVSTSGAVSGIIPYIDAEYNQICAQEYNIGGSNTIIVPLYKDGAYLHLGYDEETEPTITGDVELDGSDFIVTGDCTITLVGSPNEDF